ncbi:MAG: hypothetical protein V4694_03555, partial [Pseudomonadota bacterium]
MSRPANTRSAKITKESIQSMKKASVNALSSRADYKKTSEALDLEKEKTAKKRDIEIGLRSEAYNAKKTIKRAKAVILAREMSISGYTGVAALAADELREAQNKIIIGDALLADAEEKKRIAAEEKQASLTTISTELRTLGTTIFGTTTVGFIREENRKEVALYVSQLKEQIAAPELKVEPAGPRKDALEAYLRIKGFNQAADSIRDTGYIADVGQRTAVVVGLTTLVNDVTRASPGSGLMGMPGYVPAHNLTADEVTLVTAIITKELTDQEAKKTLAERWRDAYLGGSRLNLANAQVIAAQEIIIITSQDAILAAEEDLKSNANATEKADKDQWSAAGKDLKAAEEKWSAAEKDLKTAIEAAVTPAPAPAAGAVAPAVSVLLTHLMTRSKAAVEIVSVVDDKIAQILKIISEVESKSVIALENQAEATAILPLLYDRGQNKVSDANIVAATNALQDKLKEIREIRSNMLAGKEIPAGQRVEAQRIFAANVPITAEIGASGTIHALSNALNGADYELAEQVVRYDSNRSNAARMNAAAITEIGEKTAGIEILKAALNRTAAQNLVIEGMEDAIAKAYKASTGLEGEIKYLRTLPHKAARVKQLESALANETRRKGESEVKVDMEEEQLRKVRKELKDGEAEISKLVNTAEASGLDRDGALEARVKAISTQRDVFGERGVQELATKWRNKAKVREDRYTELSTEHLIIVDTTLPAAIAAANGLTGAEAAAALLAEGRLNTIVDTTLPAAIAAANGLTG